MGKLKIGVIGLGGIAGAHIAGILASPDAEIWSICDANKEALAKRGEELNIPAARRYESYLRLLDDPELDAVTIATPNQSHFAIAREAIRQRKPFALEKPVSLDTREAAELRDAIAAAPLPHMVCFSYRYKKAVRYAKSLLSQGRLGVIKHVYSQYLQGWGLDEHIPLVWRFRKDLAGSGALGDLGSHILDLQRLLVGNVERAIADADTIVKERALLDGEGKGEVDVDDFCHVLARLSGGVSATMAISRFAYGRGNYQRMEIYGSAGALIYDLEEEDALYVRFDEDGDKDFRKVDIPDSYQAGQMQSFINLVQGKGDGFDATLEDGYMNQRTIDSIIASFTEEKWITIQQEDVWYVNH